MKTSSAEITREYGPFPGVEAVHGVSYDGEKLWFAAGDSLRAVDPATGNELRSLEVPAHAGTAFDGHYLFQIAGDRIQKVDPETGDVVAAIPAPAGGRGALGRPVSQPQDPSGRPRNRSDHS